MFDALVFLGGQLGLGLLVLLQLNWYSVMLGNFSWVMEFLTCGYKIVLVSSKKNGFQESCCILWIDIAWSLQKIGHDLRKQDNSKCRTRKICHLYCWSSWMYFSYLQSYPMLILESILASSITSLALETLRVLLSFDLIPPSSVLLHSSSLL